MVTRNAARLQELRVGHAAVFSALTGGMAKRASKPRCATPRTDVGKKVYGGTAAPKTLVQKREAEALVKAKRALKRASTDTTVKKILNDNFKGWGDRVDTVFVADMNIRLELKRDVRLRREGKCVMGKCYYAILKNKYAAKTSAMQAFFAENDTDVVDPAVREALLALKGPKATNTRPLFTFLMQAAVPSQRTVVAIFKAALDIPMSSSFKNISVVVEIGRWVVRQNLQRTQEEIFKWLKPRLDEALSKQFAYQHGEGVTLDEWWELNSTLASLVLDHQQFETCLRCEQDWSVVEESLRSLVLKSALGRAAFEEYFLSLAVKHNADFVQESVSTLAAGPVTAASVANARNDFIAKAREQGKYVYATFATRDVAVAYRGSELKVPSSSLIDQWECKKHALLVGDAVVSGLLDAISVETDMIQPREVKRGDRPRALEGGQDRQVQNCPHG